MKVSPNSSQKLAVNPLDAQIQEQLIRDGNARLRALQDKCNIDNMNNTEMLKPTEAIYDSAIPPANGTLLLKTSGLTYDGYKAYRVENGEIFDDASKAKIGTFKNSGDLEFADGTKLNVLSTEGAAFHGSAGRGVDRVRLDLVFAGQAKQGLTGLLKEATGKEFKVIAGNMFDGYKFLGHINGDGQFYLNQSGKSEISPPSHLKVEFIGSCFDGTENGHERHFYVSNDAPEGRMFIPDPANSGRLIEYEVKVKGALVKKETGEQLGVLRRRLLVSADGSLAGGSVTLMNGQEIPLCNFAKASFDLQVFEAGGTFQRAIQGLALGPQEITGNAQLSNSSGGLFSVAQALEADGIRLSKAEAMLQEYDNASHPIDRLAGVRDQIAEAHKETLRLAKYCHELLNKDKEELLSGKYDDATISRLHGDLRIARQNIAADDINIRREQLAGELHAIETLPRDT